MAYLSLCMNGYSFLIMLVIVWLCLRLSWMLMPRRGACLFFWRRVVLITGWVCLVAAKARRRLNLSWCVLMKERMWWVVWDEMWGYGLLCVVWG